MARVKLNLPTKFLFSTEITVRITDINYGGHLGNDALLSLIHEARVRFLKNHGYTEADIEGVGLIMTDAALIYKKEVFYGARLVFEIALSDWSRVGCDFVFRIAEKESGQEVAYAKTGVVFFDYERKKVVPVPRGFIAKFQEE
ncbi:MAG TPA: thioesterase [candidate division WOR-3 bacterium]|uniref:Thioesterase n=1 Tax=candidate division WOR-3 bacterium TaxID=2052148 RepID=A0A9C9EMW6_UNCW3|nr:thioesterase [candidate division WOR-3 bacterium]